MKSSDNIINYEKLFAEYSVEQINAIENYKTSSNVLSQLTKDALDLSCEINQLEYKIDVLKGNIKGNYSPQKIFKKSTLPTV